MPTLMKCCYTYSTLSGNKISYVLYDKNLVFQERRFSSLKFQYLCDINILNNYFSCVCKLNDVIVLLLKYLIKIFIINIILI